MRCYLISRTKRERMIALAKSSLANCFFANTPLLLMLFLTLAIIAPATARAADYSVGSSQTYSTLQALRSSVGTLCTSGNDTIIFTDSNFADNSLGTSFAVNNNATITLSGTGTISPEIGKTTVRFINTASSTFTVIGSNGAAIVLGSFGAINNHADGGVLYGGTINLGASGNTGTLTFSNNKTQNIGGAIYAKNDINIYGGTLIFNNNTSAMYRGGAVGASRNIAISGGDLTFNDNYAYDRGGGIYAYNNLAISGGTLNFNRNAAYKGGAIYAYNNFTISDGALNFMSNLAEENGAAIYSSGGTVAISGGTLNFSRNAASNGGGAIYASNGDSNISGGTLNFDRNTAAVDGGAINAINVNFTGGTINFTNNAAGNNGGALWVNNNATLRAANGDYLFRGNVANTAATVTANAIFMNNYGGNKTLTLAAQSGRQIQFFDPIISNSATANITVTINPETTDVGTINFDGDYWRGQGKTPTNNPDYFTTKIYGSTVVGTGALNIQNGAIYNNINAFTVGTNATVNIGDAAELRVDGATNIFGALTIGENGKLTDFVSIYNLGTLTNNGVFALNSEVTGNGTLANNGVLNVNVAHSIANTFTNGTNATLNVNDHLTLTAANLATNYGAITIAANKTLTLTNSAMSNGTSGVVNLANAALLTNGALTNYGAITVFGTATITAGTVTNYGVIDLTLNPTPTDVLNINGDLTLDGATLKFNLDSAGASNKIIVSGAVADGGGAKNKLFLRDSVAANTNYVLMSAASGIGTANYNIVGISARTTSSLIGGGTSLVLSIGTKATHLDMTWNGGTTGTWNQSNANWSGSTTVFANRDRAIFNSGDNAITLGEDIAVAELLISGGTQTFNGTYELFGVNANVGGTAYHGGLIVDANATAVFNNAAIDFFTTAIGTGATLTINTINASQLGTLTLNSGTLNIANNQYHTASSIISAGNSLITNGTNPAFALGTVGVNSGTLTLGGTGAFTATKIDLQSGATLAITTTAASNLGALTLNSATVQVANNPTHTLSTINSSGVSTINGGTALLNLGAVNVKNGTLNLNGGAGTFAANAMMIEQGATLQQNRDLMVNGDLNNYGIIAGTAALTAAAFNNYGTLSVGTLNLTRSSIGNNYATLQAIDFTNDGVLNLYGGRILVSDASVTNLVNIGATNFNGGHLTYVDNGTLVINENISITLGAMYLVDPNAADPVDEANQKAAITTGTTYNAITIANNAKINVIATAAAANGKYAIIYEENRNDPDQKIIDAIKVSGASNFIAKYEMLQDIGTAHNLYYVAKSAVNKQEIINAANTDTTANTGIASALADIFAATDAASIGDIKYKLETIKDPHQFSRAVSELNNTNTASEIAQIEQAAVRQFSATLGQVFANAAITNAALGGLPNYRDTINQSATAGGKPVTFNEVVGATGASDYRLTGWLKGYGGFGAQGNTHTATGYDFGGVGAVTGFAYQIANELQIGAVFGYSYNRATLYRQFGSATDNALWVGGYGKFAWDKLFITSAPTLGIHLLETRREFRELGLATAKGERTGFDINWLNQVGYIYDWRGFLLTPSYSLAMTYLHDPSYKETSADAGQQNLKVGAYDSWSLTQNIELKIGRAFALGDNWAIMPEIWAGWEHEYLSANDVSMAFAAVPAQSWNTPVARINANRAVFGAGVTTLISNRYEIFGRYDQKLWDGGFNTMFTVGVGIKF